jgi:hypothetical protein
MRGKENKGWRCVRPVSLLRLHRNFYCCMFERRYCLELQCARHLNSLQFARRSQLSRDQAHDREHYCLKNMESRDKALFALWKSNEASEIGWNNVAKSPHVRNTIFELLLKTELAIHIFLISSHEGIQVYQMVLFVCLLERYLHKSLRCTTPSIVWICGKIL